MTLRKIILIPLLFLPFSVSANEITFTNPTFGDINNAPYLNTSNCDDSDPIGGDERDTNVVDLQSAEYFCQMFGYSYVSHVIDQGNADPDVCETNNNNNPSSWRFDTSSTDVFTEIVCNDGVIAGGSGALDLQILGELQALNSTQNSSSNQQSFIIEFYLYFSALIVLSYAVEKWLKFFFWLEPKWNLLRFIKRN